MTLFDFTASEFVVAFYVLKVILKYTRIVQTALFQTLDQASSFTLTIHCDSLLMYSFTVH
jgi:hypothetical protein